jgi:hypothetical protein
MLDPAVADAEAVGEADEVVRVGGAGNALEGAGESGEIGDVQATRVDPPNASGGDGDPGSGAKDHREELLALLGASLLRVVEESQGAAVTQAEPPVVDQNRRGDKRAGEGAATRLVGARDEACLERPVEPEELRGLASPALLGRAARAVADRARRFRPGRVASR